MSSVFPNETLRDIEVKRTRSGRVVIPPLAGWSGERIVSSLDDGAPLQYVGPTLDARAQYLLSSNMLERLKKQKLIQEPFKVEEQSLSIAEASDCSGKSAHQLKQKSLGTRQRKSAAHKTKNVGLSKSQSKLVCVELPETPQKKRIKMTVHYQMSDKLDHSDIHHEVKKNHQLHSHNDFDPSGFHKGIFEEDLVAGKQHTNTMKYTRNKDCKEKEKYMHQDSSHQPVHLNSHADAANTTVLTDQNCNLILPSSAENAGKAVRHLSVSSYEADDENSCEAGMSLEDSFSDAEDNVKHREQQNAMNSSHHVEISDYSQTTDMQKCSRGRRQEMSRRSKAMDKHARTGTLKRKKAVYSLHTRHNDDDECNDRRSNANEDVVLQFEHYAMDESDSSESRRKSPSPSFEFSPVYGRKVLHSKKHSHNKSIRRHEADTYLLDQEQRRPKKRLEQQNVSNDLGAIHRKDENRSGKSNKDNLFIITEFQKDENNDFRISKEDVDNYYLTDEDSDTVYTNY